MTALRKRPASFIRNASGFTSIQAASTFAVAGIVGALVVAPLMAPGGESRLAATIPNAGIDMTSTGSVRFGTPSPKKTIRRLRRSVLQKDMRKPCVLFNSGRREGNC